MADDKYRMRLAGTTISSLRKKPELLPVWACIIAGVLISGGYTLRLATRNPDVTWRGTSNPEPWQEYENKNYKLMNPTERKIGNDHPKY